MIKLNNLEQFLVSNILINEAARIDHAEDLIFWEGSKGAIRSIKSFIDLESDGYKNVTMKWDGSPAVIFGRNDEGKFVLTDKSGFVAKGYNGRPTSPEELQQMFLNRGKSVKTDEYRLFVQEMKNVFSVFESAVPTTFRGYFKGDLLYFNTPLIENGRYVFKPNIVTYAVSIDSELGRKISQSKASVVVHREVDSFGNETAITNYNFSAGQLSANVILTPGINTFFLSVSNTCGNDQENFVINYNNCIAPIITVQNTGNTNVLVPSYTLNASVNNMPSAQGISVSLNGNQLTNFTVNNNQLAAAVNLQAGINTFIISAQNACGSDSETLQVNYDNCKTPVVIINANSGLTVNSGTYNLQAQVSNMNSVQGVLLTFNGQNISNFTYNNGVVLAQVNLIPGANSFVLSAQNDCGRDSQILEINYLNCIAPNVNITSGSGTTVSNSAFNLQAQISNMTSSQGLSVQQNGQNISNYTFVNGLLNANITLSSGVNTFTINAQNACGTDAATSTIS